MKFEPKFFSIILIGRLNPQILTHDFLLKNNILPLDKSPFKDIQVTNPEQKPYDNFISTPVVARLQYRNINVVIEEGRYQITDNSGVDPLGSVITDFTKNYFTVLKFTPLALGGINFNTLIHFESAKEKRSFEDMFIVDRNNFYKDLIGNCNFELGFQIECPCADGKSRIKVAIDNRANELTKVLNFNWEFGLNNGMESLLQSINRIPELYQQYNGIVEKLTLI